MDPLSVTAGIIAVLGAGGTIASTLEKIKLIRQAPETIIALNNEISDLQLIVHETQRLLRENQERDPIGSETRTFADEVTPILIRGRDKVLELESLIEYSLTAPKLNASSRPKVRKVAWFRKQQKLQSIKDEIRSLRINLAATVGLVASKTTSRLELRVSQIQTDSNAFHSRLDNALPDIQRNQIRSADLLNNLFRSFTASHETSSTENSTLILAEQCRPIIQASVMPSLQIHVARKSDSCPLNCSCACHSRSTWRTPRYLQSFLGLLFTGYTGLPILNPKCDVVDCIQRSQSTIYFRYFFPPWLLACFIEYYIRISRSYGLSQSLRISNVVQYGAPIFLLARFGDTEGLKDLLNSRKGSPFDVNQDGATALGVAISQRHIATIRLLLDAGSDPNAENAYQLCPYKTAWNIILSKKPGDPLAEALRSMFPHPDLENYSFTPIHKAVLQMSPVSLIQVIGLCSKDTINQPDRTSRTPLMWAAYRGDLPTLKLLLLNGANPNTIALARTAIYHAARAGSYDCVDLLLRHGADPNLPGQENGGPIQGLINSATGDIAVLDRLSAAHIDINHINKWGSSNLTWAIQHRQQQIATKLIHLGANIHHCEPDNTNGLYMATYYNFHGIIKLLFDRGSDHTGVVQDSFGSYLHLIAHAADLETLKLLTNALAPRDIYYKRKDGMTALDVARGRSNVDSNWRDAFNTLISSVYQPRMFNAIEGLNVVDDVFVDAVEQQP